MKTSVQDYVEEFGVSEATTKEIVAMAARELYARPLAYGFSDTDEINEVFSRYWPRILQAVKNFNYQGASFMTYFIRTMQFLRINCYRTRVRKSNYDYSILQDMCRDSSLYESDKADIAMRNKAMIYALLKDQPAKSVIALRTRLEYLCAKCSLLLNDDEIKVLCGIADLNETRLLHLVHTARHIHAGKLERLAALEIKRNVLWLRVRNLELQFHSAEDETRRKLLGQKLLFARKLFGNAIRRIELFRPLLSNKEIAELLKIPKPTVDSGLLRLQKMVSKQLATRGDEDRQA